MSKQTSSSGLSLGAVLACSLLALACAKQPEPVIRIDGSSTLFPLTKAVADSFEKREPIQVDVKATHEVSLGISGTGGGFKLFCAGKTDISNASRPITASEAEGCARQGVHFVELPVAFDSIAVVVSAENDFARDLSTEELKRLWGREATGKIEAWSQVRQGWPATQIRLVGAGTDSGTRDIFAEALLGKGGQLRTDYASSEDDDKIVDQVAADPAALGFVGYAYVRKNAERLRALAVDDGDAANGEGAIAPSPETVMAGTYQPLSRPLFIYVNAKALDRREVELFVSHYLAMGKAFAERLGYVPLPESSYVGEQRRVNARKTGSAFTPDVRRVGMSVDQLVGLEAR